MRLNSPPSSMIMIIYSRGNSYPSKFDCSDVTALIFSESRESGHVSGLCAPRQSRTFNIASRDRPKSKTIVLQVGSCHYYHRKSTEISCMDGLINTSLDPNSVYIANFTSSINMRCSRRGPSTLVWFSKQEVFMGRSTVVVRTANYCWVQNWCITDQQARAAAEELEVFVTTWQALKFINKSSKRSLVCASHFSHQMLHRYRYKERTLVFLPYLSQSHPQSHLMNLDQRVDLPVSKWPSMTVL